MAVRAWVGGTGTWDASDTTHWAAGSGGAGGVSVPGSSDDVLFDAASGGGTVTVNTAPNIQSLTGGAHTGTLTFATNNNNITVQTVSYTGAGVRTLNLGNGTWNITGSGSVWNILTTTNLTFNANSSTINLTGSVPARSFTGNLTYSTVTIAANASVTPFTFNAACTIGTLNIAAPNEILFTSGSTYPITTLSVLGTSIAKIFLKANVDSTAALLSVAANAPTITWTALRDITGTGGATFVASDSFDLGKNTGITINAPGGAGTSLSTGGGFSAAFF